MNLGQVQSFRHLIRNMQNSLVDLSYVFDCKKIDNEDINSMVKAIDSTLYSILSTVDNSAKLVVVTKYIEINYPLLTEIKNKNCPFFRADFQQLKTDLIEFIRQKTENSDQTTKDQLNEKMNQIFNFNDSNPFDHFSGKQLPIEDFINVIKSHLQIQPNEIKSFQDTSYYLNSFLNFSNQLKTFTKYRDQFLAGEIPSEIIEIEFDAPINLPLKQAPPPEENSEPKKVTKLNMKYLTAASLKSPLKQGLGLLKIETTPLVNEKDKKPSSFHQGQLSLNGLVPKQLESAEKAPLRVQSDTDIETSQFDLMFKDIESKKGQLSNWSEIVVARLEHKAILLQKENQILRENIEIVTRQKMEIQQLYEDHINELMKQNEFLKQENKKLKEESYNET